MQRWILMLSVVLGIQVLAAGALSLRKDAVAAGSLEVNLLSAKVDADRVVIEAKPRAGAVSDSTRVELLKQNGKWVVHNYFDAPANAAKVDDLLSKLAALKRGLPIATSDSARKRFKVADDNFERSVTLENNGKALSTLYFGDSPGLRKSDVRVGAEKAIYAVDLPTYELPTQSKDWFDGGLLGSKPDALTEIDVPMGANDTLKLTRAADKQGDKWQAEGLPANTLLDVEHAAALARTVANLRVDGVLGKEVKPEWQLDQPLLTLTLKKGSANMSTWTLAKSDSGDVHVLKSSALPWYFELTAAEANSLLEAGGKNTLIAAAKPDGKSQTLSNAIHKRTRSAG